MWFRRQEAEAKKGKSELTIFPYSPAVAVKAENDSAGLLRKGLQRSSDMGARETSVIIVIYS